ncbi:two-component sensor histidine kinase [Acuticoccus sediminis]|uniref:histidine kinase n=1 Tax=Acuticoccus sediminis TaxID=2184697 RepID=A0A8B2NJ00_9HYPH|nr:ATP-binding protein [Acuticoccus sediminis]RAH99514.1 two-component sensor histidine kinase [Acuticoccus sediminis]
MSLTSPYTRPLWRRILRWAGLPPPIERWLRRRLPRRLFPRSILIIVLPMIALQSVVAFVFLDRHWENMTARLSQATAQAIAATVRNIETADPSDRPRVLRIARNTLFDQARMSDETTLPSRRSPWFFNLLDYTLSRELRRWVDRPFWIDTFDKDRYVEIRVLTEVGTLVVVTRRSSTYASNAHITLVWMAGTSLVLIAVAVLFLRGQVRPIQELAAATQKFGQGRPVGRLRPHGATEVRQATGAFLEMKHRIELQIEQRTSMLAGVSHDLRTMLTRFRLELALMEQTADVEALGADVDQMQAMLEDYLQFARTDTDEAAENVSIADLVEDAARGLQVEAEVPATLTATVRPTASLRMLANLLVNASIHAKKIKLLARQEGHWLIIEIDDDGPGIPEDKRAVVFQPFYRLDDARNQNRSGTGLGLTIARDIARRQGGEITLGDSPLGGLRVRVRVPI